MKRSRQNAVRSGNLGKLGTIGLDNPFAKAIFHTIDKWKRGLPITPGKVS